MSWACEIQSDLVFGLCVLYTLKLYLVLMARMRCWYHWSPVAAHLWAGEFTWYWPWVVFLLKPAPNEAVSSPNVGFEKWYSCQPYHGRLNSKFLGMKKPKTSNKVPKMDTKRLVRIGLNMHRSIVESCTQFNPPLFCEAMIQTSLCCSPPWNVEPVWMAGEWNKSRLRTCRAIWTAFNHSKHIFLTWNVRAGPSDSSLFSKFWPEKKESRLHHHCRSNFQAFGQEHLLNISKLHMSKNMESWRRVWRGCKFKFQKIKKFERKITSFRTGPKHSAVGNRFDLSFGRIACCVHSTRLIQPNITFTMVLPWHQPQRSNFVFMRIARRTNVPGLP